MCRDIGLKPVTGTSAIQTVIIPVLRLPPPWHKIDVVRTVRTYANRHILPFRLIPSSRQSVKQRVVDVLQSAWSRGRQRNKKIDIRSRANRRPFREGPAGCDAQYMLAAPGCKRRHE